MKRKLLLGFVLASVTWGTVMAKGSSPRAVAASRSNLVKARAVASAHVKANGQSPAQRLASLHNLAAARAKEAMLRKAGHK